MLVQVTLGLGLIKQGSSYGAMLFLVIMLKTWAARVTHASSV